MNGMDDLLRLALAYLPAGLTLGAGIVVIAFVLHHQRRRRAAFVAAFADDPHFQASPGDWRTPIGIETRGLTPGGHLLARGGGGNRNDPPRWEVYSAAPRTAARTTLRVTPEIAAGRLLEKLGFTDIHTGDAAFDRLFCLRGSEEDVVRGIFVEPAVRAAVTELFALGDLQVFTVDADGRVHARASRRDLAGATAREVLRRTLAVVAALEAHADARPARSPSTTSALTEGAGGGSGAPVAVPLAVVDPRRL